MATSPAPSAVQSDVSINGQWYDRAASQMSLESSKLLNAKIVQNVDLLQLTSEERQLMSKLWTSDTLLRFTVDVDSAAKRKVRGATYEKMRGIFYTFSNFAVQICGVVQAGLQGSPEYQPLLAGIAILLKAFSTRAETESKIVSQIEGIARILPTVDYLKTVAGNSHMNEAVSGICVEVANYVFEALHYYKNKGRIGKLFGAMVSNFDNKFGGHIQAIEAYVKSMHHLQNTATLAVSLDTLGKLDETAQLLLKMFQQTQSSMSAMSLQLEQCRINTTEQLNYSARTRVQDIHDILLPETLNNEAVIAEIERSTQLLTPQERWENRGIQQPLQNWFTKRPRPMLCFSGPHRKNRLSFLSSFSMDFASAMALEPNIGLAYVFCDLCSQERLSTDLFVRYLTMQLLQAHPKTALDHMSKLSLRRVQAIRSREKSAVAAAFGLLVDVLDGIRTQSDRPPGGYFIIIDRIDLLSDSTSFKAMTDLLPALQRLSESQDDVNIIVTADSSVGAFQKLSGDTFAHVELGAPLPVMMRMGGR